MKTFATLLVFALSVCGSMASHAQAQSVSDLSSEGVQKLLQKWKLDDVFGAQFLDLGFDGTMLDVLEEDEPLDNKLFPTVSKLHWKILLRKVAELKAESRKVTSRRLASVDTKNFMGVRMQQDNALITFGEKEDVQLVRTGPKKLLVQSSLDVNGVLSSDSLVVGASTLACSSASAGLLRYVDKKLKICDGQKWAPIGGASEKISFVTPSGVLFSELPEQGKGESFARDDVKYCLDCLAPGQMEHATDFRIGNSGPFTFKGSCHGVCEISGDKDGNVKLSGGNGNDAIRMKLPLLKGDFEYGCTVTSGTSSHNRFGMGLWAENNIGQFHSGNSAGNCGSISSGNCYFCRFEQTGCMFRGSYGTVFKLDGIHDLNAKFKFVRKSGKICAFVNGAQRGCYSQAYSGDMYGTIQNDGGSSRNLKDCYYKSLANKGTKKGNFPFATIKAENTDKTAITDYQVVGGNLPKGMALDKQSGMIFGQAEAVESAKTYHFLVKASGKTSPQQMPYTIVVKTRQPVEKIFTDFSIGSTSPFKYVGSCNSKCEIAGNTNGEVRLDGSNGNDAIVMHKPLLVGDFEYGCTVTAGTSSHNRFGMGLWSPDNIDQFRSSNSAGYCAQASKGNCYFCRFEQASCSYRGSYDKVLGLNNIHDLNTEFMFKRTGDQICAYTNGNKQGCYSQKQAGPMYGAIQNDGGSSRNLKQCYWKVSISESKDGKPAYN